MEGKKTSLGLDENLEGLLCYALGFITGIIFFLLEKDSKFVKFHAVQSIATFLSLSIVHFVSFFIPVIGIILWPLISLLALCLWIILMIKAYQGVMYKLPIVGDLAEQQANK